MNKINIEFIDKSYEGAISNYSNATNEIGIWESEEYVFKKYFEKDKNILDVGCGAGRTTFGLYEKGYTNIIGLDLSKDMISAAKQINKIKKYKIEFIQGEATSLDFDNNSFDYALFSFNGIMQIPHKTNRIKALKEIRRVLRNNGIFVFTTHDRNKEKIFFEFWDKEKEKWGKELQDERLHEYGDRITTSKNEKREIYIHIPSRREVLESLDQAGFKLVEDFYRSDLFIENDKVKKFSGECRFWIVKK
ncbi:class I SAM-dependent methyltransferase [Clostridium sp. D2Q-14]|uniref:class I SAM-dependent methyltransferase n=1 Tax=Anaeromonas gelatinilytica TaxID=2683194 RepID=UPI00193BA2BA|nr:class I SAM-dependent methyltransferase [Anaeromonas gelatinilytica]MBS4535115.1 class I SAM-dependent methyltransferase [Anaeromonas gelatinilytica]